MGVVLVPLGYIDRSLTDMPDRRLLLALDQLGWADLVTNNHKMMQNPLEIAALLRTGLSLFVVEGLGHDPIRATGAVLLDLPGAIRKFVPHQPQVFWSRPRNPQPRRPWDIFATAASSEPDRALGVSGAANLGTCSGRRLSIAFGL